MIADDIKPLFTHNDGSYLFARWGRPIVPVVFGVDDATLAMVKGAIEAVITLAGHGMSETDPELGANMMLFFFSDWDELADVPDLDGLVPDLGTLVLKLKQQGANQYRAFRYEDSGAIRAVFVFLQMDAALRQLPAGTLALSQAVQVILLWSEQAFSDRSPLATLPDTDRVVLRPDIADLIRVAYDPILPAVAEDASHALRLAARLINN